MINYITQERAKYWPVSKKLMAQYHDGSHTEKYHGDLYWRNQNDKLHRDEDKPAKIYVDGSLFWYQNDRVHRDGDKPAAIWADGSLEWYQNDKLHRDVDKPAAIWANGSLEWWQTGYWHRFSGPARMWADGRQEWWINGENITPKVRDWLAGEEWCGTPEQIVEFQLRFS